MYSYIQTWHTLRTTVWWVWQLWRKRFMYLIYDEWKWNKFKIILLSVSWKLKFNWKFTTPIKVFFFQWNWSFCIEHEIWIVNYQCEFSIVQRPALYFRQITSYPINTLLSKKVITVVLVICKYASYFQYSSKLIRVFYER